MTFLKLPLLVLLAGTTLAGCNSYAGMPHSLYVRSGQALTAEAVDYQVNSAQPRCREVARQTNPSAARSAAAGALNGAIGGALGGGGNVIGQALVMGGLNATTVGAAAVGGALYGAGSGAAYGAARAGEVRHFATNSCLALEAGGIIAVPPSDGREIVESGQARRYGRNAQQAQALEDAGEDDGTVIVPATPQ